MTKKEMTEIYERLAGLRDIRGTKINYAIARNLDMMEREIALLRKSMEMSDDVKAYDKQRIAICEAHCEKDAEGKPVMIVQGNGQSKYSGLDESGEFKSEIEALQRDYADALAQRKEQLDGFDALLSEESDIVTYKAKLSDLPGDLATDQVAALMPIVEE